MAQETPNELVRQKQSLEYKIEGGLYHITTLSDSVPNLILKEEAVVKLELPCNGIPEGNFFKILTVVEELRNLLLSHQELMVGDKWAQRYTPNNLNK